MILVLAPNVNLINIIYRRYKSRAIKQINAPKTRSGEFVVFEAVVDADCVMFVLFESEHDVALPVGIRIYTTLIN